MPELDKARFVPVMPSEPSHRVPREDGLRFFSRDPANPDLLDLFDPYEAQLLAGGSVRRACEVGTANARAEAEKAAAERAEAEREAAEGGSTPPADDAGHPAA